ncbi:unnamed protein product, partial [Brassica oleracea]
GTFLERIKTKTGKKKTKDKFGISKNDLSQQIIKQHKNLKLQKKQRSALYNKRSVRAEPNVHNLKTSGIISSSLIDSLLCYSSKLYFVFVTIASLQKYLTLYPENDVMHLS